MTIPLKCSCGRALKVKDEFAGRKVRCPSCTAVLMIPLPDQLPDAEDEAFNLLSAGADEEEPRTRATRPQPPEPELEPEPRRPPQRAEAPLSRKLDRKLDVRKKSSGSKRSSGPRVAFEQGWFGSINAGVAGGILMMIIAAV